MDQDRRRRFIAWFSKTYAGMTSAEARAKFVMDAKRFGDKAITKGRVSQLFDEQQQFGERAATNIAIRLGLRADYFLMDAAATVAPQTALPAQDQPALDLTAALGLVLDALAAMPTARWDSVQVQLAKVVRTPEMRDETLSELLFLLNVSPLGGFSTDQEDYAPEKRLSA